MANRVIARELNERRILNHHDQQWTKKSVGLAVFYMRRGSVHGLERLPPRVPLAERVAALHDRGLDEVQITEALHATGILTMHRMPATVTTVRGILRKLGRPVVNRRNGPRPIHTSRDATIRRLWAETPDLTDVTRRANDQGIRTRFGREWTRVVMSHKLAAMGLRTPTTRKRTRLARGFPVPRHHSESGEVSA